MRLEEKWGEIFFQDSVQRKKTSLTLMNTAGF
jgi:hypothetical protein